MNYTTLPHWSFGDTPQMADALLKLVLDGKKTATCTALDWHLAEPLPPVGSLQVITDGQNMPACIIQNTAQFIIRFNEVDEALAKKEGEGEGEGDLTLAYWRAEHQRFFEQFDIFDDTMWLIFEEFTVIEIL